jgi:hypothetical protein
MFRTKLVLGVAAAGLLSLTACGSDSKTVLPTATTVAPPATDGSGSDSPGATTPVPGGVTGDCAAMYQEWAKAMGGVASGQNDADMTNVFKGLEAVVPDDLKDDVAVLSAAYGKYLTLITKYQGDISKAMQDPEVMKAIEDLGTTEVQAASDNISAYFDATCPG